MSKVTQEFYCTKSGGGCGGYFLAKLNSAINGVVQVVCPKCGHKHQRIIEDGIIKEEGRHRGPPTQEIMATMGSYSKTAHTSLMKNNSGDYSKERDAVVVATEDHLVSDGKGNLLNGISRWIERFGDR